MQTVNGGQNWRRAFDGQGQIDRILFADQKNGLLAATHYIDVGKSRIQVYHTNDQGLHWIDITANLNSIRSHDSDSVAGVVSNTLSSVSLLTLRGEIFNSADGGASWQKTNVSFGENAQRGFRRLGSTGSGLLWAAGGTGGIEGSFGQVLIERGNDIWTVNNLGVFVADAVFVSDKQAFACGLVPSHLSTHHEASNHPAIESQGLNSGGVVMRSADEGRNWEIIYRNPDREKAVMRLYVVDPKHIWAVGEGGLVVRLESTE